MKLALVGPCASGKTTVGRLLRRLGYTVAEPAQEHSSVPELFRRCRPEVVVFLDASWETLHARRGEPAALIRAQRARLARARECCQLYVATDGLTPQEVLARLLDGLARLEEGRAGR